MSSPQNLPDFLAAAARRSPECGITLLDRRGRVAETRTLTQILDSAKLTARRLRAQGVHPGDRVVVALPSSFEWFDAWLGAVHLGALPVATAPGAAIGASEAQLAKLLGVVERLGARLVVSTDSLVRKVAERDEGPPPAVDVLTPAALAAQPADGNLVHAIPTAEDLAFLQLTSGSTGVPRAVQVTHGAAIHNALALDRGIAAPHRANSRGFIDHCASWVPLYHDMGLISFLTTMLDGVHLQLMPPEAFLGRPRLWLESLGSGGRTITVAPNFGYQLCVDRIPEASLDDLDLAEWQVAFSAAEMIRPETVAAFLAKFGRCGFRPENYRPCYGLAEATLVVTIDDSGSAPRTLLVPEDGSSTGFGLSEVFCVGRPVLDTEVRITGPDGSNLPEGRVGEVRARGPGIFAGYFNDPDSTADTLVDGWLRTGDLGFVNSGELYLTGRLKDLLIIRGENLMPHEIEWLAESVCESSGLERAAAFSVSEGGQGEQVILIVEVSEKDPEKRAALERELRVAVGHEFGLPLADLALVKRGQLPKTTSGKIQRGLVRERYIAGEWQRLG